MKKIYWVVVFTFLATLFFYLSQLIKETYHFSIPHAKASIQVVDWDKVKSSATIYKKLEKFSREQNLEIYKVTFSKDSRQIIVTHLNRELVKPEPRQKPKANSKKHL